MGLEKKYCLNLKHFSEQTLLAACGWTEILFGLFSYAAMIIEN